MRWVHAVVRVIDENIRQRKIQEIIKRNMLKKVMECVIKMSESENRIMEVEYDMRRAMR